MELFKIGDIIEVTINNIVSFGVFCKCPKNYTGLIHISNFDNNINQKLDMILQILNEQKSSSNKSDQSSWKD